MANKNLQWVLLFFLFFMCGLKVEASHKVHVHLQSLQAPLISNLYRTAYHFQPPRHWINDPNGPMYYKGIYHLFYQYNPYGSVWGNIVWAHSVSTDLINWTPVEPGIYPSKPFDVNGCWSGSVTILPDGTPAILYTGIDAQNHQIQNIAYPKNLSDPYLIEWVKPDYNPVINTNGVNASAFRDPTTAWYNPKDKHWRVVVGSRRGDRGLAYLYRSKDFKRWVKTAHPLHSSATTGMWECPDFFPVSLQGQNGLDTSVNGPGLKHVLKVSLDVTRYEYYTVGKYLTELDKYVPDNTSADDHTGLRYDYGNFYASKTFYDPAKHRRILWGWSNESDSVADDVAKGWAGIQTIPRSLWLDKNGRQLVQWPVEELETLRGKQVGLKNTVLKSGDMVEVKGILTSQADVEVTFDLPSLEDAEPFDPLWMDPQILCSKKGANTKSGVGPFGLFVLSSEKMEERTAVFFQVYRAVDKHVVLMCHDPSRSSLRNEVYIPYYGGFVDVDIKKEGKISLRTLIDHSVVESFGGGGKTCMTSRIYPSMAVGEKAHLFVFNNGLEDVKVTELNAWEMGRPKMN
ncbi:Beta-fructofuranosidase, insoluble isoenzyme 1 [Acorus calamus]|uniref:Beta-fructofuranosidase, insoluble isoenzyme 1 n=1 Tax=Acorus calamus TaxID=4465 RepID=A0AAV9E897_ACOCL|nr:Beta-fructofuranosidase, insoluble isoenzyme 1 [Acorus calamus]